MRVLPALLGYYHLGRLGFVLNVAVGFALAWMMAVCGILCFAYPGHHFGSVWLSTGAYPTTRVDECNCDLSPTTG